MIAGAEGAAPAATWSTGFAIGCAPLAPEGDGHVRMATGGMRLSGIEVWTASDGLTRC